MQLSSLRTDPKASAEGRWFRYIGDFEVRIARTNTPKFATRCKDLNDEHAGATGTIEDEELAQRCYNQALAELVFLDFRGLQDADDEQIENSYEKRFELLQDTALVDLRLFILQVADNFRKYLAEQEEALAGKS